MARIALDTGSIRGIGSVVARAHQYAGYRVAVTCAGNTQAADAFHSETAIPVFDREAPHLSPSSFDEIANAKLDMVRLQRTLSFIVFMVIHDLNNLHAVCQRVAALADGKIAALCPLRSVRASGHGGVIPPTATLEGETVGLGVIGKAKE
ncbi:hypothetical protein [Bradyrhizobium icense]|uniref:Uncharacterized protein n=1 Tax=Bradyrhizobium icense TaxID=1274631 RepID=A0A1B1UKF5_9BRAD|nr:hypothetical protein LMTR13_27225 [Bradyrhizobium icense]